MAGRSVAVAVAARSVTVAARSLAAVGLAVLVWAVVAQVAEGAKAQGQSVKHSPSANDARAAKSAPRARSPAKGPARAPSEPPLGAGGAVLSPEAEASASVSATGGDPLVDNGLGSPLCREAGAELSPTAERNCRISGFEAAQAPTGDYGFDVHINTGVTDVANDVDAQVLNWVQWGWTLLVAVVHGVIVMLEWCYAIDLLNSSAMGGITRGLRETQATFTQPWLGLALAVAAVLALYHGIVRRRVSETLGETALMAVMMLGGLWVILNPMGTVGALDQWANEASLGTLAAVATGSPNHSGRTLGESMQSVFSGAIGGPWCYMEFGNVRWCGDPGRLDPRLHAAGLSIATKDRAEIGPKSAEELRDARTNGELFLALPANGPQRNSINESGSLFNVLCGGSKEPCHGPTAGQAGFRTGGGTLWRVAGVALFWIGVLGMVLLLGFIGMRLLSAALFSLFFLLLAPAAVIAPALGDGGRAAFRAWVTRLLGAVCAKLIYSFLLGVVLLMQRTLMNFTAFGWAAQWGLVSAMWWWLFFKRHQMEGFVHGEHRGERHHRSLLRRARERIEQPPEVVRAGKWVKGKLRTPPPGVERRKPAQVVGERAKAKADGQVRRTLEGDYRDASATVAVAPKLQERLANGRAQLKRVKQAHGEALASGDTRKAIELEGRAERVEGKVSSEQQTLNTALRVAKDGEQVRRTTGDVFTRKQEKERERFLDDQAALPSTVQRRVHRAGGEERDYAGMARLAAYSREEFEGLDSHGQRAARLKIDRELAMRKELNATAKGVVSGEALPGQGEQKRIEEKVGRTPEQRVRVGSREPSAPRLTRARPDTHPHDGQARARAGESSVMRDAHEVIAGRKRQLGRERRR